MGRSAGAFCVMSKTLNFEAWRSFGKYFHQDFEYSYPNFAEAARNAARSISPATRRDLIQLLLWTMRDETPGGTMRAMWRKSGAQVLPSIRGRTKWKLFYQELLETIQEVETGESDA